MRSAPAFWAPWEAWHENQLCNETCCPRDQQYPDLPRLELEEGGRLFQSVTKWERPAKVVNSQRNLSKGRTIPTALLGGVMTT